MTEKENILTAGRSLLRLAEPTGDRLSWDGPDLLTFAPGTVRAFRRRAQIVFQDPYSSLNPRMEVGRAMAEPLHIHGLHVGREAERAGEAPGGVLAARVNDWT